MKKTPNHLRTWVEIDARAAKKNYETFRKLIGKNVKLWTVVKSNAYGHGLYAFSKVMDRIGIDGFCVDSVVEGLALRKAGIKKHILVLGPTLPARYGEAARKEITISISTFEGLRALAKAKTVPDFHIKIDTGMHRQGFCLEDIPKVVAFLKRSKIKNSLKGIFTHFASAKDINYPSYTDKQFSKFNKARGMFAEAGFKNLISHAAATGGTLIDPKYHSDAVRVGIGLYGLWPSKELEVQLGDKIKLYPVLSWRTVVTETKRLMAGEYVSYDLTERVPKEVMMAVLPIGYWHGFPRSLSSTGEVIVNGKRAKILGRVTMDMAMIALTGAARAGDIATLIGRDGDDEIFAWEPSQKSGTTHYEFLTRLNPLMERIVVNSKSKIQKAKAKVKNQNF
jgi:alanine racemase